MVRWLALWSLLLLVVGCTPQPRFLGTWKSSSGATITLNSDGIMVADTLFGGGRGHWQAQPDDVLGLQLDSEATSHRSKWWVSDDGKTLTLTPIDTNGAEMKDQIGTYIRQ